jgi:uncharacterized membrane protein
MPSPSHKRSHVIIKSFEAKALKRRDLPTKIADFFTSFFGTMSFLVVNLLFYIGWILINTGKIPGITPFDPYPFSFLNSTVGLEALVLTVVVLMSQKSQGRRDTLRSELGLQVELISEKELTKILQLLKEIRNKEEKIEADHELNEMVNEIDASYIERKLVEQLEDAENHK